MKEKASEMCLFLCATMQQPFPPILLAAAQHEKHSRSGQGARRTNWIEPTLRRDSSSKCHRLNQHRETPQPLMLLILTFINLRLAAVQFCK